MMKVILFTIFLFSGLIFFALGTFGILKFPEVYSRAHSSAKCDTLGAILTLLSFCIYSGFNLVTLKIIIIIIFIMITSPTATHTIIRGNYEKKEGSKDADF
jgi:multicomponent Na+:H+ antiporter subunit G